MEVFEDLLLEAGVALAVEVGRRVGLGHGVHQGVVAVLVAGALKAVIKLNVKC